MHLGREWAEDKAVVEAGCQSVTCRLVMGMTDLGWGSGGSEIFLASGLCGLSAGKPGMRLLVSVLTGPSI